MPIATYAWVSSRSAHRSSSSNPVGPVRGLTKRAYRTAPVVLAAVLAISYVAVSSGTQAAGASRPDPAPTTAAPTTAAPVPAPVAESEPAPEPRTARDLSIAVPSHPAVEPTPVAAGPSTTTTVPVPVRQPPAATPTYGYGCADALAYLNTHAAAGFKIECPGYAQGHEAMTCENAGPCPGEKLIVIADPCPAAYRNEASNSQVFAGLSDAPIDPFGAC